MKSYIYLILALAMVSQVVALENLEYTGQNFGFDDVIFKNANSDGSLPEDTAMELQFSVCNFGKSGTSYVEAGIYPKNYIATLSSYVMEPINCVPDEVNVATAKVYLESGKCTTLVLHPKTFDISLDKQNSFGLVIGAFQRCYVDYPDWGTGYNLHTTYKQSLVIKDRFYDLPDFESCSDNIWNQGESWIDCGGECGSNCNYGERCKVTGDCNAGLFCSVGGQCASVATSSSFVQRLSTLLNSAIGFVIVLVLVLIILFMLYKRFIA